MFMAGGSGVVVEDFTVITAAHVVECPGKLGIAIEDWRGNAYKAELLVADEDEDVAKLYVPELKGTLVQYGPKPRIDERVCLVGASPYRVRRCGWVESWGPKPGDMKHSAITEPGNSGGAIYDSRGFLVGIVTHYRRCSNGQLCGGAATSFRGLL
jgi:S1-C subfamily serine protease